MNALMVLDHTGGGHGFSSSNRSSYRIEPQRHPPVILSGEADMIVKTACSVNDCSSQKSKGAAGKIEIYT